MYLSTRASTQSTASLTIIKHSTFNIKNKIKMLLLILILVGVLSAIALLIILWDFFKHGGAAVLDPEHPGRIITMKEAKARKKK